MLFKKMDQLGRVISAVLSGEAEIPDVDAAQLERVWPVVVTGGELMQTELLWDRVDAEMPAELEAARVEALTILDIGDYELLLGLVAQGEHLPNILGQKARGPYRRLQLSRWMHEELHLPVPLMQRPPVLEARWEVLGQMMSAILFPGSAA
jgi:hypothetical protein